MTTNRIPGLEKTDFGELPPPQLRLVWSVYGETKTGKSSFALSGPDPIAIADTDRRLERVAQAFETGQALNGKPKTLTRMAVALPKVDPVSRKRDEVARSAAEKEWDRFLRNYDAALQSSQKKGGVRTISIDTGTELFDLRLMAEFGRLNGIPPRERGGANAEFIEVMRRGEQYSANVVWLHHSKEEWRNSKKTNSRGEEVEDSAPTGKYILDGFKKANSIVQVVAQTHYDDAARDPRKRFVVEIKRCGVNGMLNNMKFTSLDWAVWDEEDKTTPIINYGPLPYISSLAVPESSPDDWM